MFYSTDALTPTFSRKRAREKLCPGWLALACFDYASLAVYREIVETAYAAWGAFKLTVADLK